MAKISDKRTVKDLVALMERKEVRHVVICPGSRNAPFSISFFDHAAIKAYSIIDERSAAFFALGIAQQLQKPVAIICTSGTAVLNFSPAIAEAFYQRVPLFVITSDRPVEWIDQGEGQSIRQRNVFGNFIKASFEIMEETVHTDSAWHNNRIMDEAIRLCTDGVAGPVHLNFPMREPLYNQVENDNQQVKVVVRMPTVRSLSTYALDAMKQRLSSASKVLVLAGQSVPGHGLRNELVKWAELPQCVVMTEAHSNVASSQFISTIDRLIMNFDVGEKEFLLPEVLITFGHNIISRKIKEYLRVGEYDHWHVDVTGEGLDTLKHLNKIIPQRPEDFFSSFIPEANSASNYSATLLAWNKNKLEKANEFLSKSEWSDLKVFDFIYRSIPAGNDLQMGNSSVVRYVLLFDSRNDIRHFGNRGVAGVDGCTSTAVGASFISGRPTTFISGDIGFFYDSNAFWNQYVSANLKVIVINNGGGGIFRIIEGPSKTDALEKFFETRHERSAKGLADMYNLPFRSASRESELEAGIDWLYSNNGCRILEVNTPTEKNDRVLKDYFNALKLR